MSVPVGTIALEVFHDQTKVGAIGAGKGSLLGSREGRVRVVVIGSYAPSLLNFRGPLIRAMLAAGHDVTCCAPEQDPSIEASLNALGARYISVSLKNTGMSPIQDVRTLQALTLVLRRIAPDVVLAYTAKPVIYGCLAARLARVPGIYALVTGLGYAFLNRESLRRRTLTALVSSLYRVSLRGASTVFFQNKDDRAEFESAGIIGANASTCVVNGSGVDLSHFAQVPALTTSPLSFLLVGRMLAAKGVREFAEAARIVRRSAPEARFDLLGWTVENPDGIPRAELQAWQDEGLLRYLGAAEDVRPHVAKASVFVLPSYREGTPRSVLEAMSMGKPIVTTDAPGCRETVVEGVNGFLVPPRDPRALATALLRFVTDPGLVTRLGSESRRIAEERYDVHAVNAVMMRTMGLC